MLRLRGTLRRGAAAAREVCRQYPLLCGVLLGLSALSWYFHILMIFWSFVAGVVTFYCSFGPDYLLPNVLFMLKLKTKQSEVQDLCHGCAVCGKVKCRRHRPVLLLESYQPWLDLRVPSKVDASLAEVNVGCISVSCCSFIISQNYSCLGS